MPTGTKAPPGALTLEIAAILRERIGRDQLTQSRIAADARMSAPMLSAFLRGKKNIDVEKLDGICRSIGYPIVELIARAEGETTVRLVEG